MTDQSPTAHIAAIRSRVEKATPGEWRTLITPASPSEYGYHVVHPSGDAELGNWSMADRIRRREDADFIAHARTDIPALLSRYDEACGIIRELVGYLQGEIVINAGEPDEVRKEWCESCGSTADKPGETVAHNQGCEVAAAQAFLTGSDKS